MNSNHYSIVAQGISKKFGRVTLFKDIGLSIKTGDSYYITGPNGSGKTTLIHILTFLNRPTSGTVEYRKNNESIISHEINEHIGFLSPNINPYKELTGMENIDFVQKTKMIDIDAIDLLGTLDLHRHRNKQVKFYSSGMVQRLKFIMAVINNPSIFIFDEPGSNLDTKGKDFIYSYIRDNMKNKITIIATNEVAETELCEKGLNIVK